MASNHVLHGRFKNGLLSELNIKGGHLIVARWECREETRGVSKGHFAFVVATVVVACEKGLVSRFEINKEPSGLLDNAAGLTCVRKM